MILKGKGRRKSLKAIDVEKKNLKKKAADELLDQSDTSRGKKKARGDSKVNGSVFETEKRNLNDKVTDKSLDQSENKKDEKDFRLDMKVVDKSFDMEADDNFEHENNSKTKTNMQASLCKDVTSKEGKKRKRDSNVTNRRLDSGEGDLSSDQAFKSTKKSKRKSKMLVSRTESKQDGSSVCEISKTHKTDSETENLEGCKEKSKPTDEVAPKKKRKKLMSKVPKRLSEEAKECSQGQEKPDKTQLSSVKGRQVFLIIF